MKRSSRTQRADASSRPHSRIPRGRTRRRTSLALLSTLAALIGLPAAAHAQGDANESSCSAFAQTEASPGYRSTLPDCRAYELVSPPYTEGDPVQLVASAPDGARLIGASTGAFAGAETTQAALHGVFYALNRTTSGWSATPIDPPASDPRFASFEYIASAGDLETTLWRGSSSPPSEEETAQYELYLRVSSDEGKAEFQEIGPFARFMGASDDLGHVFVSRGGSLYEYAGVGASEPHLVALKNESSEPIGTCGSELGASGSEDTDGAISASGETVFVTALHGGCSTPSVNELYARVNAHRTVDLSEPTLPAGESCSGACASAPHREGIFQGASTDGSKAFFLTEQPLLNSDKDTTMDLYEAQLEGGELTHLTLVSEGETQGGAGENDATPGEGADVQGVVRVSEDGSHVYFVAEGVLTKAANSEGATALAGQRNLYVFDTLTGRTAFIATLQSAAAETAAKSACLTFPANSQERSECQRRLEPGVLQIWRKTDMRAVQSTPDGEYLVFASIARLTSDDTSGELAPQLFRYDAASAQLTRVSIADSGGGEDGNTDVASDAPQPLHETEYGGALRPTAPDASLQLTEAGDVFFESADQLTPQAVSGRTSVFEYEDGAVYLISDGQDETVNDLGESNVSLYAVDASGADAFFTTGDQLVPQATSTQVAWYDARVGGGFPGPATVGECSSSCQLPAGFVPQLPTAASAAYNSGEDLVAPAPSVASPKPQPKPLTRAQKLAAALTACRAAHKHSAKKRRACEAQARGRYAAKTSKANKSGRSGR